jgi:hypothetical protein
MAPFEALYGRKCKTPLFWNQTGESQFFGLEIIKEAERQVEIIRENHKIAQSRQKSYADPKRREVVFEVGDCISQSVTYFRTSKVYYQRKVITPLYRTFSSLGKTR